MKKLVFMFVAMAAVSFASCGGSENKGGQSDSASDSLNAPAVEEAASDSDSLTAPAATDSNTVEGSATETANN